MKIKKRFLKLRGRIAIVMPESCSLLLASSSPEERALTDPKSVSFESNTSAHPVPVDDLYYTRFAYGAAWSPNGKEVVFTTDFSGRDSLWKVNSSGVGPCN